MTILNTAIDTNFVPELDSNLTATNIVPLQTVTNPVTCTSKNVENKTVETLIAVDDLITVIKGDSSNNYFSGTSGNDKLVGLRGNDKLLGNFGDDTLIGGGGKDELLGEDGDDILIGGNGKDWLIGGDGEDVLRGGNGNDILIGGFLDSDIFYLEDVEGRDSIIEFDPEFDRIGLGGDITYDQLEIVNGGTGETVDSIFYNGDPLAVVVDMFNYINLSAADFIEL